MADSAITTANLKLVLPQYEEDADVEELNNNFRTIDEYVGQLADNKVDVETGKGAGLYLQTDRTGRAVWAKPANEEAIREAAEDWMTEHISQGRTLAIDNTLSIEGYAADAARTGEAIRRATDEIPKTHVTDADADLDIADADGNVVMRLQDGQVRTKKFYSGDVMSTKSTNESNSDLDLVDNSGNVLARFRDGGIETKTFSSDDINAWRDEIKDYIDYGFENRLANPIFTSLEKYNADHPDAPIAVENAIYPNVTGPAGYRCLSVCVTNSRTIIVVANHLTNAIGDYGDFSIDMNRKPVNGDWTGVSVLVPFDSTRQSYGAVVNNELMVDRNTGRIYLFYGTEKPNVVWWEVATADGDFRYIYSDDDGVTWSEPVSLKNLWDTEAYDYCIPSCTKGITLTDGTLVVPCFCKKGMNPGTAKSYALLLIKRPSGSWHFSSVAGVPGVQTNDECAVVEGTTPNEIWLYTRSNYNYGTGAHRGYHKFVYDTANDTFTMVRTTFDTNRHNLLSVDRITLNNQLIFLMTFTDTHALIRENITLWASLDGDVWIRVYRIRKEESTGYSVVDNYNGVIVVAYETPYIIQAQDISALSTLISDTATKYIVRNISVQDRMQMLFNAANGID